MLVRLKNGEGHSAVESGKERQRVIDATGYAYADQLLLPALKACQRFLDQE